jgi:hypothetical protein
MDEKNNKKFWVINIKSGLGGELTTEQIEKITNGVRGVFDEYIVKKIVLYEPFKELYNDCINENGVSRYRFTQQIINTLKQFEPDPVTSIIKRKIIVENLPVKAIYLLFSYWEATDGDVTISIAETEEKRKENFLKNNPNELQLFKEAGVFIEEKNTFEKTKLAQLTAFIINLIIG